MRYCVLWAAIWCLPLSGSHAQMASDSISELSEVRIYGVLLKPYLVGTKWQAIDSLTLATRSSQNIADLLRHQSAIYFKQYGNGMLATPAMRGLSASHTAVLWNGININSFTLGQSDLSALPVIAQSSVRVQYGAACAMYGTDAVAGAILLESTPQHSPKNTLSLQQTVGSFGQWHTNLQAGYSLGRHWQARTQVYTSGIRNDFTFHNITLAGSPRERQQNAGMEQWGFLQELDYSPKQHEWWTLRLWYQERTLAIQPTMAANFDVNTYQHQAERNLRSMLDYTREARSGTWNVKFAFVRDYLNYNSSQITATNRSIGQLRYEKKIRAWWGLQAGINTNYISTEVAAYQQQAREWRNDAFALVHLHPLTHLRLSLQARQAWVSGFRQPFTPSVGAEYQLVETKHLHWQWKASAARLYRVPSLNDRYWTPGGNPNLRPESGTHLETGMVWRLETAPHRWEQEITAFRTRVDDWILWTPSEQGIWSPQNLRAVLAQGIEYRSQYRYAWGRHWVEAQVHYALTQSRNVQAENSDWVDKQLPYVPLHNAALGLKLGTQRWFLGLNGQITGLRFESLENRIGRLSSLPAFQVWDLSAGITQTWQRSKLHYALSIQNLRNLSYQNYLLRAMPGINAQVSLRWEIH